MRHRPGSGAVSLRARAAVVPRNPGRAEGAGAARTAARPAAVRRPGHRPPAPGRHRHPPRAGDRHFQHRRRQIAADRPLSGTGTGQGRPIAAHGRQRTDRHRAAQPQRRTAAVRLAGTSGDASGGGGLGAALPDPLPPAGTDPDGGPDRLCARDEERTALGGNSRPCGRDARRPPRDGNSPGQPR
mgnify:CR=1 FL=1